MEYFKLEVLMVIVLLIVMSIFPLSIFSQNYENQQLPAEGVVTSFRGKNIVVRAEPPISTAVSYKLSQKKYSIGIGTKFLAVEKLQIANGEIWLHVLIRSDSVNNLKSFDENKIIPDTISGWMVGKVKSGWLVSFSSEVINRSIPENISLVSGTVSEDVTSVFIRYIFIIIGALGAILLVELNRIQLLLKSKTLVYQILIETIIIVALNLLLGFIILNSSIRSQQFSHSNLKQITEVSEFLYSGPSVSYLLIGFLFSLVCLHFVFFARKYN